MVYTSKDRKSRKVFNALDWLARLMIHIPGRYEQTVRYYGLYSNKSRGMRKKAGTDDTIPAVIPNDMSSKESRQNWARLIQKIYEVDPLVCPKCQGSSGIVKPEALMVHVTHYLFYRPSRLFFNLQDKNFMAELSGHLFRPVMVNWIPVCCNTLMS